MLIEEPKNRIKQIKNRARVEAIINNITNGKDSAWVRNALRVLRKVGPTYGTFTTCDIWNTLDAYEIAPPDEPRAMAAVVRQAKSNGWIKASNNWKKSTRSSNHGRPVRVWRWVE